MENIKTGKYLLTLAKNKKDLLNSYKLRYKNLILDYNNNCTTSDEIDKDIYDDYCDHLIVKDTITDEVIGTYRLIQRKHLNNNIFLSETEFNIDNLKKCKENILEIGRAVIHQDYRDGVVLRLLLKGIFEYCKENNIRYLFGTASFHGNNPFLYKEQLSYLWHYHLTSNNLKAYANTDSFSKMNFLNKDQIDLNKTARELPPLIRAYIKMGASIGENIYIDVPFNSLDVFVLLDLLNKNDRYIEKITNF